MKTESPTHARTESAQAQARSAQSRRAQDAPADLFAQLMAASNDVQGLLEPVACCEAATSPLAVEPPSTDEAGQQTLLAMAPDASILNRLLLSGQPANPDKTEPAHPRDTQGAALPEVVVASTDASRPPPTLIGPATPLPPSAGMPALANPLNPHASETQTSQDPALTQATTVALDPDASPPPADHPAEKRPESLRFEPAAWVSTVAKGRTRSAAPPQPLAQVMEAASGVGTRQGMEGGLPAWHMAAAGQPGHMLAQNPASVQESALASIPVAESAGGAGEQRSGQQQTASGEPGRVILESPGATTPTEAEASSAPTFADSLGQAMGESFESLGAQVSLWAASNTRRASMRLEAGLKEALEVDVTLENGSAHLAFRTDDPQAREALKAHAQQVLSHLLAQSGLNLEGMSVNTRDAQQSTGGGQGDRPDGGRRGLRQALDNAGAVPADAMRLQVQTARTGLSVYA